MVPQLVVSFWKDVEQRLVNGYKLAPPTARKFVRQYRSRLNKLKVGEAVYNRGEEEAAKAILAAVDHGGFATPKRP